MKRSLLSMALLCGCLIARAQQPVLPDAPFKVYNTATGELTTLTEMVDAAAKTKALFFGEEHNDSIGHVLELKIFKLLHERHGERLTLSMEMFETDCQLPLNDYLDGFINQERLITDARTWANYKDYSPLVDYAKEQHIPVIAANAPRRYVSLMSKRGPKAVDSLSRDAKDYLAPLPVKIPTGRYPEKFNEIMGGPENVHSPNMFASQCLWDATMASSIYDYYRGNKKGIIYHLCGRFHSDEWLGTVAQLRRKSSKIRISTISCFAAEDFDKPDWKKYENLGDFVIVTKK